jgi:hypothetical protein
MSPTTLKNSWKESPKITVERPRNVQKNNPQL